MRSPAVLVLALCLAPSARAAGPTASFLNIPVGARQVGMGQAFTAASGDVNAVWWNPAGLARLPGRSYSVDDAELFSGSRLAALAVAAPLGRGMLSAQVSQLYQPPIEARNADGSPAGVFRASNLSAGLGYARAFGALELGGALKLVRCEISRYSAWGPALDLGLRAPTRWSGLELGLAVRNLGPGLRFLSAPNALPLVVSAGAQLRAAGGWTLSADVKRETVRRRTMLSGGLELPLLPMLTLRAGWHIPANRLLPFEGAAPSGFSGGLGFSIRGCRLDYAFSPMGELSSEQRLSFSGRF